MARKDREQTVTSPETRQQQADEGNGSSQKVRHRAVAYSKLFPAFVPEHAKHYHLHKKTWKPISSSSRQILTLFTRRAKRFALLLSITHSTCLAMTPEGRRDEVVDLLNRIITSAFIKVDVSFGRCLHCRNGCFPSLESTQTATTS